MLRSLTEEHVSDLLALAWEQAGAHAPWVAGECSGPGRQTALVRDFCVGGSLGGGGSWAALGWAPWVGPACVGVTCGHTKQNIAERL